MKNVIAVFFLLTMAAYPQDSLTTNDFDFDISAGFYHVLTKGAGFDEIKLPDYLKLRRPNEPDLAERWGLNNNKAPDSPLGHGASYIEMHGMYRFNNEFNIYASLSANHGGFSYGPYNSFAVAIFPRFYAQYHNDLSGKFSDWKSDIVLHAKLGLFEDFRYYEGLTLYNLDVQGIHGYVRYKNLELSALTVGDLWALVGLNINGISDYKISLVEVPFISPDFKTDIQFGVTNYVDDIQPSTWDVVNLSAAVYSNLFRIYGQWSYRFSYPELNSLNHAALFGIKNSYKTGKLRLNSTAEFRYYGGGFNYNLIDEKKTHYRDTEEGAGGNYFGDQIYPFSFLNRPFSQWAVFTEYRQKRFVNGITLYEDVLFNMDKNFYLHGLFDINMIKAEDEDLFIYPFFKVGMRYMVAENTYFGIYATNQTMNLDKHYTTYYLLKKPSIQFEFRRDIGWSN